MDFEMSFTFLFVTHHRWENVFWLLAFLWFNITTPLSYFWRQETSCAYYTRKGTFCCLGLFSLQLTFLEWSSQGFIACLKGFYNEWRSFKTLQLTYMKEPGITLYVCPSILCSSGCRWHFKSHPLYNFSVVFTVNAIRKNNEMCAGSKTRTLYTNSIISYLFHFLLVWQIIVDTCSSYKVLQWVKGTAHHKQMQIGKTVATNLESLVGVCHLREDVLLGRADCSKARRLMVVESAMTWSLTMLVPQAPPTFSILVVMMNTALLRLLSLFTWQTLAKVNTSMSVSHVRSRLIRLSWI